MSSSEGVGAGCGWVGYTELIKNVSNTTSTGKEIVDQGR